MFIKQYGSGAGSFLCLHGWSGDHRTFEPLVPYLPPNASLWCADLPGCGASDTPACWSLDGLAREIAASFDAVPAPFTLVGNCIGALLGLRAALERPALVRRIVLIDAFARWPWYFRVFTAPGWGRYAYASTFANPIGRWMANRALASKRTAASDLTRGFANVRHDVALHYLDILGELRSPADFAPIELPIEIVFGVRTFRAVRESAALWRSVWPWAVVWELPNAGHLPLREDPAAVSRILFQGNTCLLESLPTSKSAIF